MTQNLSPYRPGPAPASPRPGSAEALRWWAEWDWWKDRPQAAAALQRWRRHPLLAGCTTADEVAASCGLDRTVPDADADARLAVLVGHATGGDQAAARVVLHRVLPALVARAAARARAGHGTFPGLLGDYTGAAWLAIVGYPLARRPTKVAGNVVWEAEHQLFGRRPLIDRRTFPTADIDTAHSAAGLDGTPAGTGCDPLAELLDLLAQARRSGLADDALALLLDLAVLGRSTSDVAAQAGVSDRTVRARRRAAVAHLAQVLDLPAPPAQLAGTRRRAAA